MLRMARTAHRETGLEQSLPRRRRRAQLRRQRTAAARRPVQAALDPARRRRRRRRARRRAAHLAPALKQPRTVAAGNATPMQGALPRARRSRRRARSSASSSRVGARYERARPRRRMLERASPELLADEKVVGWFNGRMEFGPRALGCRSILGDPRSPRCRRR